MAGAAPIPTSSFLLDLINWDLCVDSNGQIAVCTQPYSYAQDAACQVKLFKGELWYDTTQGVDYWGMLLGKWPSPPLAKATIAFQAMQATGVGTAQVFFTSWVNRQLTGAVLVTPANAVIPTNPVPMPFTVNPSY